MTATTATIPDAVTGPATSSAGMTQGAVRGWLRLEGLAAFIAGLVAYGSLGGNWLFFLPLLLVPDVSAAGFLVGQRTGTFTYNAVHNWAFGLAVLGVGVWLAEPAIQIGGVLLIAHVGMDRVVGYGLKLPSSFHDTHLGRMGRRKEG
jgi:Domain of unknown function (DUF4260)